MIGVVIATHGRLAEEMVRTAEAVVGKLAMVAPVAVDASNPDIRGQLKDAIKSVDTGDGVLLLTDLLGGSPTNLCVSFLTERKVEIVTEKNGEGTVRMSVRDYGAGISEEAHRRMFEQFFTTKEEGLGMGLAIVRSIIEAHGGKISAENINEGGARFYVVLPTTEK